MASTMAIQVRFFGTTKVKCGGSVKHINCPVHNNGELALNIGGLRKKICRLFDLPLGADITLVYIDEDRDVVTLVDDDDLREAMRQRLKYFRIDVLMNDDRDCGAYCSSSKNSQGMDVANVTSDVNVEMSVQPYPDYLDFDLLPAESNETKKKATTSSAVPTSSNEYTSHDDFYEDPYHPVYPTAACFEMNHAEAIGGMMCHTGFLCGACGRQPILGSRFKSTVIGDYSLCRICFTSWGNKTDYIRIDHP